MKSYRELDDNSVDILRELGNIGTGNAVTALSQMMEHPFDIETPELYIVKYQEVFEGLSEAEELQTGVLVEVEGEVNGVFLFLMSSSLTRVILDTMLEKKERNLTELDDMEKSVLQELGNIMCGAYIRALSQLVKLEINVSVPDMAIDMAGAILSVPVLKYIHISEEVLLIRNTFRAGYSTYTNHILFLPEPESLERIFQKLEG